MTVEISSVEITGTVRDTILALAASEPDNEVCGIVFGDGQRIDAVTPTRNTAPDTRLNFEIDAGALIAALKIEREGGPRLMGYFHSHPNGLVTPSATDRAMAAPDGRVWLIIADQKMTAWRATASGLTEVSISTDFSSGNLPFDEQSAKGARAIRDTQS